MAEKKKINPFTGKPMGEASNPLTKGELKNPFTGKPFGKKEEKLNEEEFDEAEDNEEEVEVEEETPKKKKKFGVYIGLQKYQAKE